MHDTNNSTTSNAAPVFTTTTGQPIDDSTLPKVEHVIPKRLRVNDPGYAAAARKRAHDRVQAEAKRQEWKVQRDHAIAKQRAKSLVQKRENFGALTEDLGNLERALNTLRTAGNSKRFAEVEATHSRLVAKMDRLNDAIEALEAEIGTLGFDPDALIGTLASVPAQRTESETAQV